MSSDGRSTPTKLRRSHPSPPQAGPSRRKATAKTQGFDEVWEDVDSQNPEKPLSISSRESASPRRVARSTRSVKLRSPHKKPVLSQIAPRTQAVATPKKPPAKSIPLLDTLNLFLLPFRLLLAPINILLSPLYAHLANGLLLLTIASLASYFILPLVPSIILKLLGKAFRSVSSNFIARAFNYAQDSDISLGKEVVLLPAKTLATPACLLTGLFCHTSLLSQHDDNGTVIPAKPFWSTTSANEDDLDVGQYARVLTKEARGARDIFESVRTLNQGGVAGGLEYVRIWELAVAVNTGSTLEGKGFIAEQLRELGDMTRDLSDEIVHIDSKTVNAFSWLQWEFKDLVDILSRPPSSRPSTSVISGKLHSLILRLSTELDSIYTLTSTAAQQASRASEQGQGLYTELNRKATGLQYERDRSPGWKRVYDKSTHFLVGGEPSKAELVDRDLKITTKTIGNIRALSRNLEETRIKVKVYRDQIGMFGASMMGFHLGSSEEVGLGPEEEIRVLNEVVEGLARSVGMAKQEARNGGSKSEILEIDQ
ncbi:uncharacterized protein I206_101284 [Kwoniella pini CBS 10737]|uniref:Uncharacterized protein n=1 Tax=Kwoniella pini CBS 10737 TaxID=1296096 RepID=A0A1B9IBB5_9TREE|nr:uncharacterized protein I206_00039 [Kwoniella pini CBS 10737]OCF52743.1 hypothetical protein I206_00039 [Kwoniella pini CBS 10737]